MYQLVFLVLIVSIFNVNGLSMQKTTFTDCGVGVNGIIMNFKDGYMRPEPVEWPGNATVGGQFIVKQDLPTKLKLKLNIKKSTIFGKITFPCIKSFFFGSCDFDVCDYVVPNYHEKLCNQAGICSCPVKAGTYNAKDFVQPLPNYPIISKLFGFLIAGDYDGTSTFVDPDDESKVYGCLNVKFTLVRR